MFCAIIQAYVDGVNSKIFPVWGALRTAGYNEKQMFNTFSVISSSLALIALFLESKSSRLTLFEPLRHTNDIVLCYSAGLCWWSSHKKIKIKYFVLFGLVWTLCVYWSFTALN